MRADPSSCPRPISYRLVRASRGGPYSAVITRTGGACIPLSRAQPAPAQIARHGFKVPRARSESFPNAAESGPEIEFLTVKAGFWPCMTSSETGYRPFNKISLVVYVIHLSYKSLAWQGLAQFLVC